MGNWSSVLLGGLSRQCRTHLRIIPWRGETANEFIHQFLSVSLVEGCSWGIYGGYFSDTYSLPCAVWRDCGIRESLGLRNQAITLYDPKAEGIWVECKDVQGCYRVHLQERKTELILLTMFLGSTFGLLWEFQASVIINSGFIRKSPRKLF